MVCDSDCVNKEDDGEKDTGAVEALSGTAL